MTSLARYSGSKAIGGPGDYSRNKTGQSKAITNALVMLGVKHGDRDKARPWTPDGEEVLIQFFHEGLTVRKMCKEFNRSWPDVGSRLVKLGMEKRLDPESWPGEGNLYEGIEWP